jgi:CheY-like chemotaxis protein
VTSFPSSDCETVNPGVASLAARTKRILVVDDEPAMRGWIESCLRKDGFDNVIFSHNGSEVGPLVVREQPHLIIMDVMMPHGNGLRALRSLKTDPSTQKIPVIVMSGYGVQVLEECANGYADAFLAKPFPAPEMLAHVCQFLE